MVPMRVAPAVVSVLALALVDLGAHLATLQAALALLVVLLEVLQIDRDRGELLVEQTLLVGSCVVMDPLGAVDLVLLLAGAPTEKEPIPSSCATTRGAGNFLTKSAIFCIPSLCYTFQKQFLCSFFFTCTLNTNF